MNGIESYYYKPEDLPLAEAIHQALLVKLNRANRGLRKARFFVLFHTDMPAVLIEPAYISNEEEYNLILTESYRKKIADAVVEGIINYYAHR
jgi:N-acetylmuramoyl-L-alanine amidase